MGKDFQKKSDNEIVGEVLADHISRSQRGRCLTEEEISRLIDGTCPPALRDRCLAHLAACDRCREVYALSRDLMPIEDRKVIQWRRPLAWAASFLVVIVSLYVFFETGLYRKPEMKEIPAEEEMAFKEVSDDMKSLGYLEKKSGGTPEESEKKTGNVPEKRSEYREKDRSRTFSKKGAPRKEVSKNPPGMLKSDTPEAASPVVKREKAENKVSQQVSRKKRSKPPRPKGQVSMEAVQARQTDEAAAVAEKVAEQHQEEETVQNLEVTGRVTGVIPGGRCFTSSTEDGFMLADAASDKYKDVRTMRRMPTFSRKVFPEISPKDYRLHLNKTLRMEVVMDSKGAVLRVCAVKGAGDLDAPVAGALLKCRFVPEGGSFPVRFFVSVFLGSNGPEYQD